MKFLVDAVLPASLATEGPAGVEFVRWSGGEDSDEELVRAAASGGARAVIFFDRNSLVQPGLVALAEELGVALVAVDAPDPVEAKERILLHTGQLRRILHETQFALILASEVRSFAPPTATGSSPDSTGL